MASFNYVLVTEENFQKLNVSAKRHKVKNYYLLNQQDFSIIEGDTLWEKVTPYGGIIISEAEAQKLRAGTLNPPVASKSEQALQDAVQIVETEGKEASSGKTEKNHKVKSKSKATGVIKPTGSVVNESKTEKEEEEQL